jgi:hypothetical protein
MENLPNVWYSMLQQARDYRKNAEAELFEKPSFILVANLNAYWRNIHKAEALEDKVMRRMQKYVAENNCMRIGVLQ